MTLHIITTQHINNIPYLYLRNACNVLTNTHVYTTATYAESIFIEIKMPFPQSHLACFWMCAEIFYKEHKCVLLLSVNSFTVD